MADSFVGGLKKFLVESNAMSLALGVVIGGAVGKLVATLVSGLIMPIVTLAIPSGDWRAWSIPIGSQKIAVGEVMGATIDFLIISVVVYIIASRIMKTEVKK